MSWLHGATPATKISPIRLVLFNALLCGAYVLLGVIGLNFAMISQVSVTAVWPPSGLAVAFVFLLGPRMLPGVVLGSLLINLRLLELTPQAATGIVLAVVFAASAGLQAWLSSYLITRFSPTRAVFDTSRGVIVFFAYGAMAACLIDATIGATGLLLADVIPRADYALVWMTLWLGNAAGILIFASFLIIWLTERSPLTVRRTIEVGLLMLGLILLMVITFNFSTPITFVFVAVLGLIGYLYGNHAASAAIVLTTVIAIFATTRWQGPFALPETSESLLVLEAFIATITFPVLLLTAAVHERNATNAKLEESNRLLEAKVTERTRQLKQALDEAESASRAKSLFIAHAAHEFRTPLAAIAGYSDLLIDGAFGDLNADQADAVTRINEGAMRMNRLVGATLELSSAETGRITLAMKPVRIRPLLKEVLDELESLARAKQLTLTLTVQPDLPERLLTDTLRLQQIVINLVGNAIKFTDAGAVTVEAGRVDSVFWFVRVTDTGVGISEEDVAQLFTSFRRLNNTAGKAIEGTGLGLAITYRLVSLMGGQIAVKSQPGQGSSFTVTLPIGRPVPETEPA